MMFINSIEASEKYILVGLNLIWFMVKLHTSDMQMHMTYEYLEVAHEYIRVRYRWHTDDIRVCTSDIRMTYEQKDDIQVYTNDTRVTYEYIQMTYENTRRMKCECNKNY